MENYEVLREEDIKEHRSHTVLLRHKKSGAHVFTMSNDDINKVFAIGFRTPPHDSTGLPHILEHSVLCGSRKYPVKDPFIELAKGSLNTFLNAMTYPDKTVYPVASCNDTDFMNLVDVYMDAVLYPDIYREERIFMQEGWHYELEDEDGPLRINGVVYNEMKGAFSNPDEVIDRCVKQALLPDTPYGYESGGAPEDIPTLTYEDFLAFHKKYYHPSNSWIFLYGDMDMEEKLRWLDESYLKDFDCEQIDSEICLQEPFEAMREEVVPLPITDEQSEDEESSISYGFVCGDGSDAVLKTALSTLETILIRMPGAPLKQALLDQGLAGDVYGGLEGDTRQNFFSLTAKGCPAEKKDAFLKCVMDTLQDLADKGLDKESLKAAINSMEFSAKEGDTGRYPRGLLLGLSAIGLLMYDSDAAFTDLAHDKIFAALRDMIDNGGFEDIIRRYFIGNPHSVVVIGAAEKGLQREKDEAMARRMEELKKSWSEDEVRRAAERTKYLADWQESEDAPEDLAKIPMLGREDLRKKILPLGGKIIPSGREGGPDIFFSDIFTSGIIYYRLFFDAGDIPGEDLPYYGLLYRVLGLFDTENYSYHDLSNRIGIETGGMSFDAVTYTDNNGSPEFGQFFMAAAKVFAGKAGAPFPLLEEILCRTDLSSDKRLKELLDEIRYSLQSSLSSSGHSAAVLRAASRHNRSRRSRDIHGGIDFYRFIEAVSADFENKKDELREGIRRVALRVLSPERLMVQVTCAEEDFEGVPGLVKDFADRLSAWQAVMDGHAPEEAAHTPFGKRRSEYILSKKNEGFQTPAGISYVACAGNYREAGCDYSPHLAVLETILSYDYLWGRLRVRGGAYGAMCSFGRDGEGFFVSYRDPNLAETLEVYKELADYVEGFDVSERDMTKFLIGTLSSMDRPLQPREKGERNFIAWMHGSSEEELQADRDKILAVTPADIRALAPLMRAIYENGDICVIGNESKIAENADIFDEYGPLFSQNR